jgi:N-acyl homoserine lactone hydrolase
MERIRLVDGDTELLPGLELIETSGHVPGHQSVLVRLPKTGAIVLTIDAVPFGEGFTRDEQDDGSNPDAQAIRASTVKLLDLVERSPCNRSDHRLKSAAGPWVAPSRAR